MILKQKQSWRGSCGGCLQASSHCLGWFWNSTCCHTQENNFTVVGAKLLLTVGLSSKFNNMLSLYPRGSYCSSNCFQLVVPETPISNFLFPNSAMVNNNQIKSYYIAAVPKLFDCDHCNLMKCILSTCSIESAYDTNRGCEKSGCFVFSKKWHGRTRQAGLW